MRGRCKAVQPEESYPFVALIMIFMLEIYPVGVYNDFEMDVDLSILRYQ